MLRRSKFRDYYDIYSILREGFFLKPMVDRVLTYSDYVLKSKGILNFISNGKNFSKDSGFKYLQPKYDIGTEGIEKFIKSKIKEEYQNNL